MILFFSSHLGKGFDPNEFGYAVMLPFNEIRHSRERAMNKSNSGTTRRFHSLLCRRRRKK